MLIMKTTMVDLVKTAIRSEVDTFLCEVGTNNPANIKRAPFTVDEKT
jgi:hypothetical protein